MPAKRLYGAIPYSLFPIPHSQTAVSCWLYSCIEMLSNISYEINLINTGISFLRDSLYNRSSRYQERCFEKF